LREALGDDSQRPRYIATAHRRGYRFITKVVSPQPSIASREIKKHGVARTEQKGKISSSPPAPGTHLKPVVVGRDAELQKLRILFAKAVSGERQIVFVTGEPGIGKTTFVENFVFGVQESAEFRATEGSEAKVQTRPRAKVQSPGIPTTAPPS